MLSKTEKLIVACIIHLLRQHSPLVVSPPSCCSLFSFFSTFLLAFLFFCFEGNFRQFYKFFMTFQTKERKKNKAKGKVETHAGDISVWSIKSYFKSSPAENELLIQFALLYFPEMLHADTERATKGKLIQPVARRYIFKWYERQKR